MARRQHFGWFFSRGFGPQGWGHPYREWNHDWTKPGLYQQSARDLEQAGYGREIGLGVYDIHSPRVPPPDEMATLLEEALEAVGPTRLWVNPDCGLKTRDYPEVLASLRNMVAAARTVRDSLTAPPR